MKFPSIYINCVDPKFMSNTYWRSINKQFNNQSPTWKPGKYIFNKEKYTSDEFFIFVIYITLLYREFIVTVVKKRKWEKFWIPLNPKYLKWKKSHGRFENMWMNTGTLIDSISISWDEKLQKIKVGIDGRLTYKVKGRRIPILLVCKWMEYGTCKMPARPLWRKARQYISKNIRRYYQDFEKMMTLLAE